MAVNVKKHMYQLLYHSDGYLIPFQRIRQCYFSFIFYFFFLFLFLFFSSTNLSRFHIIHGLVCCMCVPNINVFFYVVCQTIKHFSYRLAMCFRFIAKRNVWFGDLFRLRLSGFFFSVLLDSQSRFRFILCCGLSFMMTQFYKVKSFFCAMF